MKGRRKKTVRVYLIRHGMTPGNALRRYIGGRSDEPLADEGRAVLSEIRDRHVYPHANRVYISPMARCRETAEILFPGVEQRIVPALKEMDFGVFEQRSAEDMKNDAVYKAWVESGCEAPIPEGERKQDFTDRCCKAFLREMKEIGPAEEPVVFVVHGGTIMSLIFRLGKPERSYYDCYVKNGHGYACEWDGDVLHIRGIL